MREDLKEGLQKKLSYQNFKSCTELCPRVRYPELDSGEPLHHYQENDHASLKKEESRRGTTHLRVFTFDHLCKSTNVFILVCANVRTFAHRF